MHYLNLYIASISNHLESPKGMHISTENQEAELLNNTTENRDAIVKADL